MCLASIWAVRTRNKGLVSPSYGILGEKKIKLGIKEIELAIELEFFIKKHGATLSFDSVIAFGSNASKPHHVPTNTKLQRNQFVLMDFGVKLNN